MRLRAPVPEDAPAVFEVLAARDLADLGRPDITLEDVRGEWAETEFDVAVDAVVVELEAGQIAAYGAVRHGGSMAVVAPSFERRGIGARLLEWVQERERRRGDREHRQWIATANLRGRELLLAAGYRPLRSYWRMVRPLSGDEAVADVAGLMMRPIDLEGDAAELHGLDAASFSAVPDYEPASLTAFWDEHLGAHDVDVSLSRVVESDGRIVAFALTRRWAEEGAGFLDLLAVHPDSQRRGIGTALLETVFGLCAEDGLREVSLGVASDNPKALHLYERVGMRPRFQFDTYQRPLT